MTFAGDSVTAPWTVPFRVLPSGSAYGDTEHRTAMYALHYMETRAMLEIDWESELFPGDHSIVARDDDPRFSERGGFGLIHGIEPGDMRSLSSTLPDGRFVSIRHVVHAPVGSTAIDPSRRSEDDARLAMLRYIAVARDHLTKLAAASAQPDNGPTLAQLERRAWAISAAIILDRAAMAPPALPPKTATFITRLATPWSPLACSFLDQQTSCDVLAPTERDAWTMPPVVSASVLLSKGNPAMPKDDNLIIEFKPISARARSDHLGNPIDLMRAIGELGPVIGQAA